jgi:ubiquitin C-terminal hydrolase
MDGGSPVLKSLKYQTEADVRSQYLKQRLTSAHNICCAAVSQGADGRPGQVGLQNLGRTCYMNSALQCLMHTDPLRSVFVAGAPLNLNPQSHYEGEVVGAFQSLMSMLWQV